MSNSGEASVEEILESIKKVMERDTRATVSRARQRKVEEAEEADALAQDIAAAQSAEAAEEDEVLDLADLELTDIPGWR